MMISAVRSTSGYANSIDEVVDQLTALLGWASDTDSRAGYFAALYRKVTLKVRDGIRNGMFDDAERMERFDVIFANRYLEAFKAFRSGGPMSSCWLLAFQSTTEFWPIVLQHLLMGMSAHINLDLGVATAATMRGDDLEAIHGDFDKINAVLAALVDDVQNDLAELWPGLRLLNPLLGNIDDAVVNFSLEKARDNAWRSAQDFAALPDGLWAGAIAVQDRKASIIGKLVRRPGVLLAATARLVRIGEIRSTRKMIRILS
jgi:hypothetical protein